VSTTRRWGVALTAVAVAMWAVIVAAIVTTAPDEGANFGAGMVFLLAVPCTVTGLGLIAGSRRPLPPPVGARPYRAAAPEVPGNSAVAWSLVVGVAGLLLGFVPLTDSELPYAVQAVATLLAGLVAVVLGGLALRRARRRGASTLLALTGTIVGAATLGLHGLMLPELIGLLITTV
jgi:hypothetical protein